MSWSRRALALLALMAPGMLALAPSALEIAPVHFDQRRAMAVLGRLTSEELGGRKSGAESGARTEEYLAAQFRAAGLAPAGEAGGYYQAIPLLETEERAAKMELLEGPYGRVPFLYGEDYAVVTNSGSGNVTAEVVIAGHGLCDPTREWDDYGDLDVRGKIVLIVRGAPENGYDWDLETARDSTLTEAARRGAAGVLYLQEERPVHGGAVHAGAYFPEIPVAYIGHHVADLLFVDSGRERDAYEKEIASQPSPFATGKRLHLDFDIRRVPGASTRNVLAMVPGSDPALRDEVIVIGAHMDHLGRDAGGRIFNGADDNGSGTAVVIELARAFAAASPAPRRTLLFAGFCGEEQGLLGSEAFVAHPPLDLGRVIAMVNFDMAGHGSGKAGFGGGEYFPEILKEFRAALDSAAAESLVVARAWGGDGSDHAPFWRAGIPAGNLWGDGPHHFYHRLDDDIAWIDSTTVGEVGRMAERWIRTLADWPAPLHRDHRNGLTWLRSGYQVDFDGTLDDAPGESTMPVLAADVRWSAAERFASEEYLDELGRLSSPAPANDGAAQDEPQLIDGLSGVRGAAREWQRGRLLGVAWRAAGVPRERLALLRDLRVSLIRVSASPAADAAGASTAGMEQDAFAAWSREGMRFLVSPDTSWAARLPAQAKALVRVFANHGERILDPDRYPRGRFAFIVSLDGPMPAADLARMLMQLGWDRVHLDLAPWLLEAGEDPVAAFLEELQAAGPIELRHLRSMLGGNLSTM